MTPIPTWLQAHLEKTGAANTDGVRRAIRATTCRDCGAGILTGLDADRAALPVVVDVDPVTELGEVLALAAGRVSYNLRIGNGACELDRRDRHTISAPRRYRVVVSHECGNSPTHIEEMAPRKNTAADNGEIPF